MVNKKGIVLLVSFLFLSIAPAASAASATMQFTPSSGSYTVGTPFTTNLVIDGNGDAFNAAKTTVVSSANMTVTDVLFGDCNFSFITTPSLADLSFVGAILGNSRQRCTAYTLTVIPNTAGIGSLTLNNASVKKYATGEELLIGLTNGNFALVANPSGSFDQASLQTQLPSQSTQTQQNIQSYTLSIKAVTDTNTPLPNAIVVVDAQEDDSISQAGPPLSPLEVTTDANGVATIPNVAPGVHKITVEYKGNEISNKIINASGDHPVLTMSIKKEEPTFPHYMQVLFGSVIIVLFLVISKYIFPTPWRHLQRIFTKVPPSN